MRVNRGESRALYRALGGATTANREAIAESCGLAFGNGRGEASRQRRNTLDHERQLVSERNNPMHAGHRPPARLGTPGELLFTFRDHKHRQIDCELRYHGQVGVEAMFLVDREFRLSRRFDTKELAIQWAELERPFLEKGDES